MYKSRNINVSLDEDKSKVLRKTPEVSLDYDDYKYLKSEIMAIFGMLHPDLNTQEIAVPMLVQNIKEVVQTLLDDASKWYE